MTTDPAVLDLLALVHTTPAGDRSLGRQEIHSPESREVASLCARVRSVAEIGAELCLPLAAVQFAVGDLSRAGLVTVRHPPATTRPGADLLERVLHGLVSG